MKATVYITGSIAAYKAINVVRNFQKEGHEVRVVMTKEAVHLIGTQTLAALTKYPVLTDLWEKERADQIQHIELADWTEIAVVVPATANFIAKIANGIADDAASTTFLATASPKYVVPAMNSHMWSNPAFQRNLALLKQDGIAVMDPATGRLAEGYSGKGRMPEPDNIMAWIDDSFQAKQILAGKKIVITAGGTISPLDPVRFLGNRSSGKMGIALAKAALVAGAEVILISGHIAVSLPNSPSLKNIKVETTEQMCSAVKTAFLGADALIMAAAVADYEPVNYIAHKIKKQDQGDELKIYLKETPDILKKMGSIKKANQVVVGFAAETNNLLENASKKLQEKKADMIVANDVSHGVFGSDEDKVMVLRQDKTTENITETTKVEIAKKIIVLVAEELESRKVEK
ncbi:bifunctional phosphopantothenoylcysteine decarboxylase/phosphopantothenate--cysteine ligase CoaBC [Lactobacillus gasseri]|uniref:bifunctional phosphopantothenoylcysteine decarboxylase/phosphopantothenate--cysteine ligase CoaBC n=1 Tax=Lactobacillus gasseri TaxID=1596 RepID=UPI00119678D2|nr:bifunctional phosphopantothenoylcysteine decarboxylase/phosphopantothenate--cysteine ligase CoaBC [Lactobacillus gasseri]MDK7209674.1 bifunctional phosphopantothenoylcysteine decarboxylase/phosphopantothenate--cysteine ligase CoaBC [Lactobacillus gasseri]MDK8139625.1 bifunctional phosphopantothenoylcysteine decarboxylase/phosphopantothenate--cysteine ligase CoaBC [Lactobacillus gasseri]TVV01703.1 bifunctional phosphopantothenoylcysteine decarboxylase/phosphopantothenate--cysteine ligase CoaBC